MSFRETTILVNGIVSVARGGRLQVVVMGGKEADPSTFAGYLDACATLNEEHGPPVNLLIYAPDLLLSAAQRKRVKENAERTGYDKTERVAVLSDSSFVRGVMLAIGWLMGGSVEQRPFSTAKLDQAIDHLDPSLDHAEIKAHIAETIGALSSRQSASA